MRLIRLLISCAVFAALVYFVVAVPLGQKTLLEHLRAIGSTEAGKDLVDGVKKKAGEVTRTAEREIETRKATPHASEKPVREKGKAEEDDKTAGTQSEDKLTPKERRLLRRLIKEKLAKQREGRP